MRNPALVVVECVVASAVLVLGGCDDIPSSSQDRSSATAPIGSERPSGGAPPGGVEILVNGTRVVVLGSKRVAEWPSLDAVVPEAARRLGTWQTVELKGSGKSARIDRPSTSYPDLVPVVFPGLDGSPAFGMFDRVELTKRGQPAFRHDAISEIRITRSDAERSGDHQGTTGAVGDPTKLVLEIATKRGTKTLTGEAIMAIPREPMPGNDDQRGWQLTKLLAAADVTTFKKLVLIDAAGPSVIVERADLDERAMIPFVKLNRQGSLRFRLLRKQGDGWQVAGDLRALASIRVE